MNIELSKNKSEDNIKRITSYYNNVWCEKRERPINIGWGYEQRRIHSTIIDFLNIKKDACVLEIGCGGVIYEFWICTT